MVQTQSLQTAIKTVHYMSCESIWKRCGLKGAISECPRVARGDGLKANHKVSIKKGSA